MSTYNNIAYFDENIKGFGYAPADWSGNDGTYIYQFRAVAWNSTVSQTTPGYLTLTASTPTAHLTDTASNYFAGIMMNAPKLGEAVQLCLFGTTKAIANSGSIVYGCPLTYTANGFIDIATSTDLVIGQALAATNAKGDIFPMVVGFGSFVFNS